MNNNLYDMIFKRKSFHLFRNIGNEHITEDELKEIENEFNNFIPLVEDIKVKIKTRVFPHFIGTCELFSTAHFILASTATWTWFISSWFFIYFFWF